MAGERKDRQANHAAAAVRVSLRLHHYVSCLCFGLASDLRGATGKWSRSGEVVRARHAQAAVAGRR